MKQTTCPVCGVETYGDFTLDYCEFCWNDQRNAEGYEEIFIALKAATEIINQFQKGK
jgi:hypothetical protein